MNPTRVERRFRAHAAALTHVHAVERRCEVFRFAKTLRNMPKRYITPGVLKALGLID